MGGAGAAADRRSPFEEPSVAQLLAMEDTSLPRRAWKERVETWEKVNAWREARGLRGRPDPPDPDGGTPEHGRDVARPRPSDALASILLGAAALVGVLVGTIVAATEEGRGSDALLVFLLVALPPAALALLLTTTRKGTPQLVLAALVVAAALCVVVLTFSSDAGPYAAWLVLSAVLALAGAGVAAARARRVVAGQ